jgi:transcriptional regulator of acetoin/glycerol metabolism
MLSAVADETIGGGSALAIRWVFPSSDGSITRLVPGAVTFGRDASCAGCLPSASVSRTHAEIRWTRGDVPMLHDLDSTNGVFLNGRLVKQAPMRTRDVLRIGDWIGVLVSLPTDAATAWTFQEVSRHYWAGPTLLAALAPARLVATTDLPVIIQGETGVGKEGAANAIHAWSGRSGPFLALNCAALPAAQAEGELFGYRKGAFSGAERANPGFLRAAHGGTLLLDEIAELPLATQAKLLRAIEQREVVPVGESRPVAIDVRLLAATQGPLRQAVEENRLRGDLLARLQGLTVEIPPLRARVEEVPFLFAKLIEAQRGPAALPRFDPLLVERLCTHDWPFNVRELALLTRRLLARHPDAAVLAPASLSERREVAEFEEEPTQAAVAGVVSAPIAVIDDPTAEIRDPDHASVLAALRAERGNVRRTAAALGISRGRLYRLMDKLGTVDLELIRPEPPPERDPL